VTLNSCGKKNSFHRSAQNPDKITVEEIKSGIKMIERKVYPEERVASIDDG
jgi:hypothetical protein